MGYTSAVAEPTLNVALPGLSLTDTSAFVSALPLSMPRVIGHAATAAHGNSAGVDGKVALDLYMLLSNPRPRLPSKIVVRAGVSDIVREVLGTAAACCRRSGSLQRLGPLVSPACTRWRPR